MSLGTPSVPMEENRWIDHEGSPRLEKHLSWNRHRQIPGPGNVRRHCLRRTVSGGKKTGKGCKVREKKTGVRRREEASGETSGQGEEKRRKEKKNDREIS